MPSEARSAVWSAAAMAAARAAARHPRPGPGPVPVPVLLVLAAGPTAGRRGRPPLLMRSLP
eukprot:scaffold26319_cov56-Phaeocystis_antarctica.AAC.1